MSVAYDIDIGDGGTLECTVGAGYEVSLGKGEDGTEVELQKGTTYIQWRLVGGTWTNLIAIADITGTDGEDGTDGTNGTNGTDGTDGLEVELQKTATYIQWRLTGGEWANLVALADIKGDPGVNTWGDITGTLANQTDLQAVLDGKNYFVGFPNRTDSTYAMNGADFEIDPAVTSYVVWCGGAAYTISAKQTVTISNDKTLHFVYFEDGVLKVATTAWDITGDVAPVAVVFKDGSNYAVTDERHAHDRDRQWHKTQHNTIGALYKEGFTGTFTNTTLSITEGIIYDEDIEFETTGTKTACSVWYREAGTGKMRLERNSTTPYRLVDGELAYDSSGTLTKIQQTGGGRYGINWIYASNDPTEPIYCVVGQAQYANLAAARNASLPSILLLTAEWKLIYKVIYRNIAGTATYIEAADYRSITTGLPISSQVAADHASLINRDATDSHPAAAISVDSSGFTGNLGLTDDNVQTALTTIDAMTTGGGAENGEIRQFTGSAPSADWNACDGSVYLQASYPLTYAKVGLLHDFSGWTIPTVDVIMGNSCHSVGFGGLRFVKCGTNKITYSTDHGVNWTEAFLVAGEGGGSVVGTHRKVFYVADQSRWYAVGDSGSVKTSDDDGETWTTRDAGQGSIAYQGGCDSGGVALICGASGTIVTTPDAVNWTARTSGTANQLNGAVYMAGCTVVVGNTDTVITSEDLATWVSRETSAPSGNLYDICRGDSWFVAVGQTGRAIYSANGHDWAPLYATHANHILVRVATDGSRYLIGNYTTGQMYLLTEGLQILPVSRYAADMAWGGIAYGNGAWNVGGANAATPADYRFKSAYAAFGYNVSTHFRVPSPVLDGVAPDSYIYMGG